MRSAWTISVMAGVMATPVFGGVVTFSPGFLLFPPRYGQSASFTLTLHATGDVDTINGADVLIGSSSGPEKVTFEFAYSDEWLSAMTNVSSPIAAGYYGWDVLVGGSNPSSGVGRSIVLGTVTLSRGSFGFPWEGAIYVDSEYDDGISGIFRGLPGQEFVSEPLFGVGRFGIAEPGSLALLGVGVLCALRRRMTRVGAPSRIRFMRTFNESDGKPVETG